MIRYCFISVLYSTPPNKSETVLSLLHNNHIKEHSIFCFWDNSPCGFKKELNNI